jgi:hypothetical protein
MKAMVSSSACAAAVLAFSMATFAQSAGQQPTSAADQSDKRASAGQEITVTGCIQREADFRKAHDAGRGGAAGSGVGAGNEFVLTDASKAAGSGERAGESPAPEPTGTSATRNAYELTGPSEGQAAQYVGKRVEIRGKLKAGETGAYGATGGPTAGTPPSGVDVTSRDLKLRELEVTSVRESTGTCPTSK